jgi:hypothetical protein
MAIDPLFKLPRALEMTTARCSPESPALFNMIHPLASSGNCTPFGSPLLHRFTVLSLKTKNFTHDLAQLVRCILLRETGIKKSPKDSVATFDLVFFRLDMPNSF